MKLDVGRYTLKIIPESPQDEAYLEEVLGFTIETPRRFIDRRNVIATNRIAYVEILRKPPEPLG